jgi:short-subunit dehydrogenase
MNTSIHSGTALITGASSGIGAVYADRLARRGHDLVLVAGDRDTLCVLAARLTDHTGRSVEVVAADLATKEGLRSVERVLSNDASMTLLVNNAATGTVASRRARDPDEIARMIDFLVTVPMRLACVACSAFAARGHGTIINIASIAADPFDGVTIGAKAFVLAFSRSLHRDPDSKGIRVQVVLPDAEATGFWETAGIPLKRLPGWMVTSVANMVDAAIAGLDLGEIVTTLSPPDVARWGAHEAARRAMRLGPP